MPNDHPLFLDHEEKLLWDKADGFQRSLLRRISIARQEADRVTSINEGTFSQLLATRTQLYVAHRALVEIKERFCECRADCSDLAEATLKKLNDVEIVIEKTVATDQLLQQIHQKLHSEGHRPSHVHKSCDFCAMMCTIEELRKT